jgi:hypothetical protein
MRRLDKKSRRRNRRKRRRNGRKENRSISSPFEETKVQSQCCRNSGDIWAHWFT